MHAAPPPAAALANSNIQERRLGSVITSGYAMANKKNQNRYTRDFKTKLFIDPLTIIPNYHKIHTGQNATKTDQALCV